MEDIMMKCIIMVMENITEKCITVTEVTMEIIIPHQDFISQLCLQITKD